MAHMNKKMFPDSGMVTGPSHANGGVYASVANGPDVELEGGEFIINKEATEDFLPLIKQINDIGRAEQMGNAQNAHSAIDTLIASADMQNRMGGGLVNPKSPIYQEGGQTKTLRMTTPVSRDIKRKGDMFTAQSIMSIPAEQVGGKEGLRYYLSSPQRSQSMQNALTKSEFDARNKMAFTPEDSLPLALVEGYFDRQNKKSPLEFLQGLLNKEQGGMIQYEEGGPLHSRRMFNQGTGFNKKKSDLDNDGTISEYEKKRGMAIAKSMNQMQEGGAVADRTRVAQTFIPTESLNLPLADLANPRQAGSISRAPMTNEEMMQIAMDVAMPGKAIGSIAKKLINRTSPPVKASPFSMKAKASKIPNRRDERGRLYKDPIGGISKKGLLKLVEDAVPENTMGAYAEGLDYFKDMDADDLADVVRGAYGLARNPRFYGEERIGQGAFDMGREGVKMALDDIKNLKIKQQGGMIGRQQPMMQRPMNPAMNLSPMQRMGNNMPPLMYQEGGAVADKTRVDLPAQIVLDNLARRIGYSSDIQTPNDLVRYLTTDKPAFQISSPEDNDNIENFFKIIESIDAVPKSRKSMQMGGQVQLRKQAEMRKKPKEKMNVIFPFINEIPFLYPNFQGPLSPSQSESLNEFLKQLEEEKEKQPKKLIAQEGGMISDNNLMGAMANDRRVAALQPDVYSSKMENGMMVEEDMVIPKLSEAILPTYGIETPLSKRQNAMLKSTSVSPRLANPQMKGLINRALVQRLSNEQR